MVTRFLRSLGERFKTEPRPAEPARSTKPFIGVGAVIDQRYRLDAELGRGGMGIVYRARDLADDRAVAIKIMNVADSGPGARADFLREASIAAQLHHPHIVAVYATGAIETGAPKPAPYIAMELVGGSNLDDLRQLTFAQIIDLARQICDALAYAHGLGLVHRDLKPGNVLVEKHGYRYVAKLMDFGLARPRGSVDLDQANVAGTVYYLAPELIEGKPADVSADLYALGVMLYELVTGRVPFSNFDAANILSQHLEEAVIPPSHTRTDVPPALEAIILRLLAKDPAERFASAQAVNDALAQIKLAPEQIGARYHLPPQATRFIGRRDEIAQIQSLLESNRLVALVGAGGSGKTRLALAIGEGLSDQFADGVWFVDLEPWHDPALLPHIVAATLGARQDPRRALMVSLTEYLSEKNLLIILDHCDQLVGACAQIAETCLRVCPDVRILATSDKPLNSADETIYRVPALSATDAAQLLTDRLGAASHLSEAELARVGDRCGGNPLALELAAAGGKEFSPAQLDPLPSATLDAVIDWSYRGLPEPMRVLLNRLSVFVSGFSAEAAESFCGTGSLDEMNLLAGLVDRAFVKVNNVKRYRMPASIRRYALAQLRATGEEETMRRNHRDGFLWLARQAEPNLRGVEQDIWLKRLEMEYPNLIAALQWTLERPHDANLAFQFGGALWHFWEACDYWREGRDWLAKILALPHKSADASARVKALIGAGYLAHLQADDAAAQVWLEQSLEMARELKDKRALGYALCGLGALAQARRDDERATQLYRAGWEECRIAGNPWEAANAQFHLGILNLHKDDYFGARSQFLASLDTFRQIGDQRRIAQTLHYLGLNAYDRADYAEARTFLEEGLALARGLYDKSSMANQLNLLGYVALRQGQPSQAREFQSESLALFKELNSRRHMADVLHGFAGAWAAQRQPERAAKLIGAADALLQAPGTPAEMARRVEKDLDWVISRIVLDSESFQSARAAGAKLSLEQAITCAIEGECGAE